MRFKFIIRWLIVAPLLIIGMLPYLVIAQRHDIKFKHITIEQGLSHKNVLCILQDSKGYIWFGTKEGLNVYDGYSIKVFVNDSLNKESLSSNHIQALFEDTDGYIWIGTYDGGLNRFDRKTGKFKVYSYQPSATDGLSSDNICAVKQDKKGNIWIGTFGGGLCRLNKKSDTFKVYQHQIDNPQSLSANSVFSIHEDKSGTLWLGTFGGGLCHFDPDKECFSTYINSKADSLNYAGGVDIYSIFEDASENLWIGTNGSGLYKFNKHTKQFKTYTNQEENSKSLSSNYIHSIQQDALGILWIGTKGGGLNRFDSRKEEFAVYRNDPFNFLSISDNTINTLFLDKENNIWVGTHSGGVSKVETQNLAFTTYANDASSTKKFIAGSVISVHEDKDGIVWIGTFGDGLYAYDKQQEKFDLYKNSLIDPNRLKQNIVTAICEDNIGNIWIGTSDNGLCRFNKKTKELVFYQNDLFSDNTTNLSSNSIETLFKDTKGKLWIGTYDGGLCNFNPNTNQYTCFQHDPMDTLSISSNTIKAIYEDKSGNLWIGTKDSGLAKFDQSTQKFINYKRSQSDTKGLTSNFITAITEDNEGFIWIGTFDGGLNKFNPKTGIFEAITIENGLPSNSVCGILTDSTGNIWISTTKMLSRFTPSTKQIRHFAPDDGLYNDEFVQRSYYKSKTGELYFGGLNHFMSFYPKNILDNQYIPPIYITAFNLFNQKKEFEKPIWETDVIELNHDDNYFSFEFVLLSYLDSDKNQYAYKMEGIDKEWNYVGNQRRATYTNLDAKEYIFRVKAADKNGVWNESGTSIKIIIHPAWYNTWLFRISFVFTIVGASFVYYQARINSIQKQKKILEGLVVERTAELIQKNEKIEAQKNSIEATNASLMEAQYTIEEQNEELKTINNDLENRVEQRTRELTEANVELIKSNEELDMFIYRASHDIRGPIASILGLCKVAQLDIKDETALSYIQMLNQNSEQTNKRLLRILSIYDIRKTVIRPKGINILPFVSAIINSFESLDNFSNIKFDLSNINNIDLITDEILFHTVLQNLIENAILYRNPTTESCIGIAVFDRDSEHVCIQISDNGIGIPIELQSKLFTMFFRGTLHSSGVGLGLYIVKNIVEKLQGKIYLQTENRQETVFEIQLPKILTV